MIIARSDCDTRGVPLDWERCRRCQDGAQRLAQPCPVCDGHGSLRAKTLTALVKPGDPANPLSSRTVVRCEDCNHPASTGQWSYSSLSWRGCETELTHGFLCQLVDPHPEFVEVATHFSACDAECQHRGPGRRIPNGHDHGWRPFDGNGRPWGFWVARAEAPRSIEASWRQVDMRMLNGWVHDLREENLALLCLRCWAQRPGARASA